MDGVGQRGLAHNISAIGKTLLGKVVHDGGYVPAVGLPRPSGGDAPRSQVPVTTPGQMRDRVRCRVGSSAASGQVPRRHAGGALPVWSQATACVGVSMSVLTTRGDARTTVVTNDIPRRRVLVITVQTPRAREAAGRGVWRVSTRLLSTRPSSRPASTTSPYKPPVTVMATVMPGQVAVTPNPTPKMPAVEGAPLHRLVRQSHRPPERAYESDSDRRRANGGDHHQVDVGVTK